MVVTAAAFLHAPMTGLRRRLTPERIWRMLRGADEVGTSLPPLFVPPGMEARAAAGQRPLQPPIFRPAAGPMAAGSTGPISAGSTGPMAAGPPAVGAAATWPAAQPGARRRFFQMPAASVAIRNVGRTGAQAAIVPMPAPWARPASPDESARSAAAAPETQAGPALDADRPAPSQPRLQRQPTAEPADPADVAPTADGTLELLPGRMEVVRGADMKEIRFIRSQGGDTVVTFGRSDGEPHVHIRLEALTVSRIHAAVHYRAGRWYVENRSRTNPALLNGAVLDGDEPAVLADGDLVEMGEVLLRFRGP